MERKNFLEVNKSKDNVLINGNNNILLSAPHGVSQVRLGKPKHSEIGSLTTALFLQKYSNCFLIARKTRTQATAIMMRFFQPPFSKLRS